MHRVLLPSLVLFGLLTGCAAHGMSATRSEGRRSYAGHGGGGGGGGTGGYGGGRASAYGGASSAYGPSIEIDLAAESSSTGYGASGDTLEASPGSYGGEEMSFDDDDDATEGESMEMREVTAGYRGPDEEAPPPDAVVARATSAPEPERRADASAVVATGGETGSHTVATVTDAGTDGPLLIYTAGIWLAVYEVRESQATIVSRTEELGGHVQNQTDTLLVLRVPAAQFDALIEAVSGVGDLLHREIAANDVSEEFRDVEIRIRNLEAMRERLEILLTQATEVEDALRVERELERVTVELERLRGRQRFLADRISFSTITIHFEARPRDRIDQPEIFALPFYWLQNLGLPQLLELH